MSPLDDFAEQLMISVAMTADENRVGCEDGDEPDLWEERLTGAVYDGLEEARARREEGHPL